MSATHLVSRFVGSLWPMGPGRNDETWARSALLPGELALWDRMSNQDRRHSVGVARRVMAMSDRADRPVLAAALLHDVGKVDSALGTFGRVIATLSAALAGRETAELWVRASGFTRRIGLYLKHPEIGADLLALAGSDALTIAWAREHHLPEDQWTIERSIGRILKVADDD